jgi:hypothetical protein
MGFGKEELQKRHLRVAQPEEIRHVHRSIFEPWSTLLPGNQWVLTLVSGHIKY